MLLSFILFILTACGPCIEANASLQSDDSTNQSIETNKYVALSMQLLEGTKKNADLTNILTKIADISLDDLVVSLDTKNKKMAFWINLYNGFIQYDLVKDPNSFEDKDEFYKGQRHEVAGIPMSFDNMEHGILRNSRIKLSLGYLKRWFVSDWEKKLRNTDIDGRIHFALNCGAKSCPPVAIFNDIGFDEQIDAVVTQYLKTYTTVNGDIVSTSPLFSWFRADFGGKKGVLKFLKRFEVVPDNDLKYSVEFDSYDWTISTGNYSTL